MTPIQSSSLTNDAARWSWEHVNDDEDAHVCDLSTLPPQARCSAVASAALRRYLANDWARSSRCPKCWLSISPLSLCICSMIHATNTIAPSSSQTRCQLLRSQPSGRSIQLGVYIHHKELGRASNSAKLLFALAQVFVAHVPSHERRLREWASNQRPAILFPSRDSQYIDELAGSDHIIDNDECKTRAIKLLLIDGTWSEARSMQARLPIDWPRVQLRNGDQRRLALSVRKQPRLERVNTVAAAIHALEELNVDKDNEIISDLRFVAREFVENQQRACRKVIDFDKQDRLRVTTTALRAIHDADNGDICSVQQELKA